MSPNVSPRGTEDRANNLRGSDRTAFESAALLGFPRWLNFATPDPDPKPDPKPDPNEERFAALEKKASDAEAKANAAHAELRRLKKSEKPTEEIEEVEDDDKSTKIKSKPSAADKELSERLAKLEKDRERTARNAKRNALKEAFTNEGITGENQTDAIDLFMVREGSKLIHDEESDTVLVKDSEIDDPKPVSDYITALGKAGKLKRFKAAPATNTTGPTNGAKGNAGGTDLPKFKRTQDVPPELMASGKWALDIGT